ncbi:DUF6765 family protein [Aliamphritea ceti]|uniref:DUF6765 family protein n=1 Tax=Aliamphritea ceti TaxID=1524258 RepID=UPI0021C2F3DC|nr:DUF6765 family protein [Aliamphritea ceti]
MQEDMHYYGTYALARAAGLPVKQAQVIAYAAQYVDDSTDNDSEVHKDGGMFETVATAHTNAEAIGNAVADQTEQRKVWMPFHFFPGGEGETISEKLLCTKDGPLAQEMVANHLQHALKNQTEYALTLLGITAHVYADTFSHYGFSGVSSGKNKVDSQSFELDVKDPQVKAYIMGKMSGFFSKYAPNFLIQNYRRFASDGASVATGALGHGAVGTYPDRPFLRWRFNYKLENADSGWRNNKATFLEGCEKLHALFSNYAKQSGSDDAGREFSEIRDTVAGILALEAAKDGRIDAWKGAVLNGDLFQPDANEALHYDPYHWREQRQDFEHLSKSAEVIKTDVYRFHQAAAYHRNYTLKQLLPRHGILVL